MMSVILCVYVCVCTCNLKKKKKKLLGFLYLLWDWESRSFRYEKDLGDKLVQFLFMVLETETQLK